MKHLLLILILILQTTTAEEQKDIPSIETKIKLISVTPLNSPAAYISESPLAEKPTYKAIPIAKSYMPNAVKYKGPIINTLYSDPHGKSPLAKVIFKKEVKETIILLLNNKKQVNKAIAINGQSKNFPKAARRIFNFTSTKIRGEWGQLPFKRGHKNNQTFSVKAGSAATINTPDASAPANQSQPFILEALKTDKWITCMSTRWFHAPHLRHFVFLVPSSDKKRIVVRTISEWIES